MLAWAWEQDLRLLKRKDWMNLGSQNHTQGSLDFHICLMKDRERRRDFSTWKGGYFCQFKEKHESRLICELDTEMQLTTDLHSVL